MTTAQRYKYIIAWISENMPVAETELHYSDPFGLLVAVILSAQCTDKRVNMITPRLLADFPTPEVMAASSHEVIFEYIRSISYPNNKAKHLVGMAQKLVSDFGGEMPDDIDQLQTLPGVGRKTANVILNAAFNKPVIAVDTHIFRVANRTGLASGNTPLEIEKGLMKRVPARWLLQAHHWLVLHGRYICKARKPLCSSCPVRQECHYAHKTVVG